jgi:hypothetical protein
MNMANNILSVIKDGVEYRCEQTMEKTNDYRGDEYSQTVRSKWLSRDGREISDDVAMNLFHQQKRQNERDLLMSKLWGSE